MEIKITEAIINSLSLYANGDYGLQFRIKEEDLPTDKFLMLKAIRADGAPVTLSCELFQNETNYSQQAKTPLKTKSPASKIRNWFIREKGLDFYEKWKQEKFESKMPVGKAFSTPDPLHLTDIFTKEELQEMADKL